VRAGDVVRRYEHDKPCAIIHVDVKKLGNIPDGGGWRYVGRKQADRNKASTNGVKRSASGHTMIGTAYVHTVIRRSRHHPSSGCSDNGSAYKSFHQKERGR